ncbi:MAG: Fibronectin type III domain protein [Methanomassiliicoccales archaeon PtaU1.Bin124]|nr:MAG: Fibronectin type III domain protein [Methanomassiliicoccales archaeon PtaU1.Bin124]
MQKRYLSLLVITALLLPGILVVTMPGNVSATSVGASQSWLGGTLDSSARSSVSTAVDADGFVHISFFSGSNTLKYMTNANGEWTTTTVDTANGAGFFNSIAVDAKGKVHIAYYDSTNLELKYATNAGGSWAITVVTSTGDVGKYNSIAVGKNGTIGMSFYDSSNNRLMYASLASGSWTVVTVDSNNAGVGSNLCYAADDKPVIVYLEQSTYHLMYATNNAGTWTTGTVDSGTIGAVISASIDSFGYLYVAYNDVTAAKVKYARQLSSGWNYAYPANDSGVATSISLKADSHGLAHMVFYDVVHAKLMYVTNSDGDWSSRVLLTSGDTGSKVSLALDEFNKAHVAYIDGSNDKLDYLTDAGASWISETVAFASDGVGKQSVVLVDGKGVTHVAYYDEVNGRLLYANDSAAIFEVVVVDRGNVGMSPAMALDSANNVYISYYDLTNKTLKYASNAGGVWAIKRIDASTNVGSCSGIAVDANGTVNIVYRDDDAKNLKYTYAVSGSWYINPLVSSNNVGSGISLISDSTGKLHLAYFDDNTTKYGYRTSAGWTVGITVESTRDCSGTIKLAVNKAGDLGIVFLEKSDSATTQTLWYSVFESNTWSSPISIATALASGSNIEAALVMDSDGMPHVYFVNSEGTSDLLYKQKASGIWMNSTVDNSDISGTISAAGDANGRIHLCYYDSAVDVLRSTVNIVAPSVPQNVNATGGNGFVTVRWEAPVFSGGDSVSGYRLYRGTSADSMTLLLTMESTNLQYNDTTVLNGKTYYYKVEAINSVGASEVSAVVSASPVGPAPTNNNDMLLIIIAVLAVAVVVAVVALFMLRNRGPKPPKSKFQQPKRR